MWPHKDKVACILACPAQGASRRLEQGWAKPGTTVHRDNVSQDRVFLSGDGAGHPGAMGHFLPFASCLNKRDVPSMPVPHACMSNCRSAVRCSEGLISYWSL